MSSWRGKLGFLIPAGTPTVEVELPGILPAGVSAHYARMVGHGADGTLKGLAGRIATQIEHLDETATLLASCKPNVMVLAHTATCYYLGRQREEEACARISGSTGVPFITVLRSVVRALERLGVRRIALGTPYDEELTLRSKAGLESYGFEVVSFDWLKNVRSVFEEPPARAYGIGRAVDRPEADAVFLSGVGMATLGVLQALEDDLGKPVISSTGSMVWNALRTAGIRDRVPGYGRLFSIG